VLGFSDRFSVIGANKRLAMMNKGNTLRASPNIGLLELADWPFRSAGREAADGKQTDTAQNRGPGFAKAWLRKASSS
jgi:hypothetical protein